MKITIRNRIGKLAKDFLEKNKFHVPYYRLCHEKVHNGVVIDIDDDSGEEFSEYLERNGFIFESDDEIAEDGKSVNKLSLHLP